MQDSRAFLTATNFVDLSKRGTLIEILVDENANAQLPLCYSLLAIFILFRYIQVGNAVAVPVALALGYSFGMASQGLCDDHPLATLPFKFPECLAKPSSTPRNPGS